jgi:hypothetical protein
MKVPRLAPSTGPPAGRQRRGSAEGCRSGASRGAHPPTLARRAEIASSVVALSPVSIYSTEQPPCPDAQRLPSASRNEGPSQCPYFLVRAGDAESASSSVLPYELSRLIERGTISCLALKDQRSLREEQPIQWSYVFVFEWVMRKADPFLFSTGFLLPDSQKAKIPSGWPDACPAAKISSGWICVDLPSITSWMSVGATVCSWGAL